MNTARQALILAAGRGSRMGHLTGEQPKCFTPLAGKRLLDWQLEALRQAGIERIAVVGGYQRQLLAGGDYTLLENPDWERTNMVATLRCAAELLRREATLVSYSDIVYRAGHVRALAASTANIAITYDRNWRPLWEARFENPLADAETFGQSEGWLTHIGQRATSLDEIPGQYMGLLRFSPEGWSRAEAWLAAQPEERQQRIDMTSLIQGLLSAGIPVACVPVEGGWCEVDCETDVRLYESLLAQPGTWSHDWRG